MTLRPDTPDLHDDPRVLEAGAEPMGLWLVTHSHCTKWHREGRVTHALATRYARSAARARALALRLVRAGLWREAEDGWIFLDWEEAGAPSGDALSKKRQDAGRRGAAARWQPSPPATDGKPDGKPMANAMAPDGKHHGKTDPEIREIPGSEIPGSEGKEIKIPEENTDPSDTGGSLIQASRARGDGKPDGKPAGVTITSASVANDAGPTDFPGDARTPPTVFQLRPRDPFGDAGLAGAWAEGVREGSGRKVTVPTGGALQRLLAAVHTHAPPEAQPANAHTPREAWVRRKARAWAEAAPQRVNVFAWVDWLDSPDIPNGGRGPGVRDIVQPPSNSWRAAEEIDL